jgi:alpha-glucan,water dikinase
VQVYDEPTVLVAKRVTGEEEVPEGAVAVLTPDAPDVLSHVSVRARNMKVLFAICHEEGTLKEVEDKEGTTISLQVLHPHLCVQRLGASDDVI